MIRELNDRLRTQGRDGMIVMTNGVAALEPESVHKIFEAIVAFQDFTQDNDPWNEHDSGVVEVEGHRVIWKIDLYEDANVKRADGSSFVTRVMTVMFTDEY